MFKLIGPVVLAAALLLPSSANAWTKACASSRAGVAAKVLSMPRWATAVDMTRGGRNLDRDGDGLTFGPNWFVFAVANRYKGAPRVVVTAFRWDGANLPFCFRYRWRV